jgi:hypothetical protein
MSGQDRLTKRNAVRYPVRSVERSCRLGFAFVCPSVQPIGSRFPALPIRDARLAWQLFRRGLKQLHAFMLWR